MTKRKREIGCSRQNWRLTYLTNKIFFMSVKCVVGLGKLYDNTIDGQSEIGA